MNDTPSIALNAPADDLYAARERANHALRQALMFTPQDLEANRRRELTQSQREHLQRFRKWSSPQKRIPIGHYVLAGQLSFLSLLLTGFLSGATLIAAVCFCLLLAFSIASHGYSRTQRKPDPIDSARIDIREGTVWRRGREGFPTALEPCNLEISGLHIPVSAVVADAFVDGRQYRIHYVLLDGERLLVSAEQTYP